MRNGGQKFIEGNASTNSQIESSVREISLQLMACKQGTGYPYTNPINFIVIMCRNSNLEP